MRALVTGSAGHLGEGLVRTLRARGHDVVGLDLLASQFTDRIGSVSDHAVMLECMRGVDVVIHTATLHKPHVATHSRQAFVDTNVSGTLTVLEAALVSGASSVVFSSTTSTFGGALTPAGDRPARWIDEDDDAGRRREYDDLNLKVNELLYRRLDLADAVDAHILAAERAADIGFRRYVVSATAPFDVRHLAQLRTDAPGVVRALFPDYEEAYARRGWKMLPGIERVYVNHRARQELGWRPRVDFRHALDCLRNGADVFSALTRTVGSKGSVSPRPPVEAASGPVGH